MLYEVFEERECSCCLSSYLAEADVVVATVQEAQMIVQYLGGSSYYRELFVPTPEKAEDWIAEHSAREAHWSLVEQYSDEYFSSNPKMTIKQWAVLNNLPMEDRNGWGFERFLDGNELFHRDDLSTEEDEKWKKYSDAWEKESETYVKSKMDAHYNKINKGENK